MLATNDAFLVALDAKTGEVAWETERADSRDKVAQTPGPVIVNGKAITDSRCDFSSPPPGGCFITAHDVRTGEELWRVHTVARADEPEGTPGEDCRCRPGAMRRSGWSGATTRN